jgi:hypothetical protein
MHHRAAGHTDMHFLPLGLGMSTLGVLFAAINSTPNSNSIAVAPDYDFTKAKARQG